MKNDLFKNKDPFYNKTTNIFNSPKQEYYTVIVVHVNGDKTEHEQISNPWAYIKEVVKNPNVKTAFIKNKK